MERINTTLEGAERKAALCMLLEQETELLSAIERHKNEANLDNRDKRIMQFLEKVTVFVLFWALLVKSRILADETGKENS